MSFSRLVTYCSQHSFTVIAITTWNFENLMAKLFYTDYTDTVDVTCFCRLYASQCWEYWCTYYGLKIPGDWAAYGSNDERLCLETRGISAAK